MNAMHDLHENPAAWSAGGPIFREIDKSFVKDGVVGKLRDLSLRSFL